jgi:hypothetical protein
MKYLSGIKKEWLQWMHYDIDGNIYYTHGMYIYKTPLTISCLAKNFHRGNLYFIGIEGKLFEYNIEKPESINSYGIGTIPITSKINELRILQKEYILKNEFTKNEYNQLAYCNLDENELVGKYIDKNGCIYFNVENKIYKFNLKINTLKNIFKKL